MKFKCTTSLELDTLKQRTHGNWKYGHKVHECSFVSLNFKVGFWQGLRDTIRIAIHRSRYDTDIMKINIAIYCRIDFLSTEEKLEYLQSQKDGSYDRHGFLNQLLCYTKYYILKNISPLTEYHWQTWSCDTNGAKSDHKQSPTTLNDFPLSSAFNVCLCGCTCTNMRLTGCKNTCCQ